MKKIMIFVGVVTLIVASPMRARAWQTFRVNARRQGSMKIIENLFTGSKNTKKLSAVIPVGANASVVKALQGNNPKNLIIIVGPQYRPSMTR